jgi:outer membrane lipoprotein-sorting protein
MMRRSDPRAAACQARAVALALLGLLLAVWAAPTLAALDLPRLTALLAERKSGEARFTEERFVSGFDGPLRASGVLSFRAPDHFARHTLEPVAESMVVEGQTVTLKRGNRTRQLTLDTVPELTALLEAVRATLTGNASTLERHFIVRVDGAPALWTLTLLPRSARLAAQVRELQIAGQNAHVRSVGLWLANGDRSMMVVQPLQALSSAPPAVRP